MAVPILTYHNVAREAEPRDRWRALYVHPGAFARQMWLLHALGYRGLSMAAARPYLAGARHGRVAVITLDDGYVDNLVNALPVLQRHGFSATCYAVSGALGRFNEWDAVRLGVRKPVMDAAQLRAWRAAGMEVGSHSVSHPHLDRCDDASLRNELQGSKAALEDVLGAPVLQFCYPYGSLDERVVAAVRTAGYAAATTTRRGRVAPGAGVDWWRLPRVAVKRHHLLVQFAQRVATAYEDRRA